MRRNTSIIITLIVILGVGFLIWQFWSIKEAKTIELTSTPEDYLGNWMSYRDEESKIEFKYPNAWGEIMPEFREDHAIRFSASNESIYEIWYHVVSGNIFFVERGEFFDLPVNHYGEPSYQGVVKVIYPEGGAKTVYADEKHDVVFFNPTRGIKISPNGDYIYIGKRLKSYVINVATTEKITEKVYLVQEGIEYDGGLIFGENDIHWSSNNEVLAIRSHVEQYAGGGIEGLFVSDYGNPDLLSGVYIHPMEKYHRRIHLHNVSFINNEEIYFEIGDIDAGTRMEQYIYNAKEKMLWKIYKDEELGFEMRCPTDFELETDRKKGKINLTHTGLFRKNGEVISFTAVWIAIASVNQMINDALSEFISERIESYAFAVPYRVEKTNVGGEPGLKIIWGHSDHETIFLEKDKNSSLMISYGYDPVTGPPDHLVYIYPGPVATQSGDLAEAKKSALAIIEQIILSFRFLK